MRSVRAALQNLPSGLTLVLHGEGDADMDSILDFVRAASPWVAMGLLLAIFFVRSAVKKKKGKKQDGDYGTEGMCLVIGFMIHKNQDSSDA